MELIKLILPVITTILGAGLSLLAIEAKNIREDKRKGRLEKKKVKSKILEYLMLCDIGLLNGEDCKKEITRTYASNFDVLTDAYLSRILECFDENGRTITSKIDTLKNDMKENNL